MDNVGPSKTALVTGYARAYHQIADRPTIFTDPLAARLLGVTADDMTELSTRTDDQTGRVISDQGRRLFFAARARFAEDAIVAAAIVGTRQVVILGAGLDTFAYRTARSDLRVFEVDHPATQAWKRERLAAAGIDCPRTLTFVPVDFETHTLARQLEAAAFVRTEPAIFVWLGVIFYLTPSAARATLEYIAGQAQPVEVVFDYLQSAHTDEDRAHLQARANRLASAGEPFVNYFTPLEIASQLGELGFTEIEDHSAVDVISGYVGESPSFGGEPTRALRASRVLRASTEPRRDERDEAGGPDVGLCKDRRMVGDWRALNLANWEARVPLHLGPGGYDLASFDDSRYLSGVVRYDLPRLGDIAGLDVLHLQCHIGTDTVSLARLGPRSVTGLDFSRSAIAAAAALAERAAADVRFVEGDVHDAAAVLGAGCYDLVYTGIGAVCWLPDIRRWAAVVAALLRPGGRLFMREGHPMLDTLSDTRTDDLLVVHYPYFETAGTTFTDSTTYGGEGTVSAPQGVSFNHGLGEVFTALTDAGLTVTALDEHREVPWNALGDAMVESAQFDGEYVLAQNPERLPLTYTIQALKV